MNWSQALPLDGLVGFWFDHSNNWFHGSTYEVSRDSFSSWTCRVRSVLPDGEVKDTPQQIWIRPGYNSHPNIICFGYRFELWYDSNRIQPNRKAMEIHWYNRQTQELAFVWSRFAPSLDPGTESESTPRLYTRLWASGTPEHTTPSTMSSSDPEARGTSTTAPEIVSPTESWTDTCSTMSISDLPTAPHHVTSGVIILLAHEVMPPQDGEVHYRHQDGDQEPEVNPPTQPPGNPTEPYGSVYYGPPVPMRQLRLNDSVYGWTDDDWFAGKIVKIFNEDHFPATLYVHVRWDDDGTQTVLPGEFVERNYNPDVDQELEVNPPTQPPENPTSRYIRWFEVNDPVYGWTGKGWEDGKIIKVFNENNPPANLYVHVQWDVDGTQTILTGEFIAHRQHPREFPPLHFQ